MDCRTSYTQSLRSSRRTLWVIWMTASHSVDHYQNECRPNDLHAHSPRSWIRPSSRAVRLPWRPYNPVMLDVSLHAVTFGRVGFSLRDMTVAFPRSTHTAIIGPAAAGKSTLLQIIAGVRKPQSGEVRIGSRDVTNLKHPRRPLLYTTLAIDAPSRWSVRHLLVAAARQRTIDREDRQHEIEMASTKWDLSLDRRLDTLSSTERTRANLARIEILKPAILVADRILEAVNPSENLADEFYRTLRVMGTTVITAPSSIVELGAIDRVLVLDGGRIVQEGLPSAVYGNPRSAAAAAATVDVSGMPWTVHGSPVESAPGCGGVD